MLEILTWEGMDMLGPGRLNRTTLLETGAELNLASAVANSTNW